MSDHPDVGRGYPPAPQLCTCVVLCAVLCLSVCMSVYVCMCVDPLFVPEEQMSVLENGPSPSAAPPPASPPPSDGIVWAPCNTFVWTTKDGRKIASLSVKRIPTKYHWPALRWTADEQLCCIFFVPDRDTSANQTATANSNANALPPPADTDTDKMADGAAGQTTDDTSRDDEGSGEGAIGTTTTAPPPKDKWASLTAPTNSGAVQSPNSSPGPRPRGSAVPEIRVYDGTLKGTMKMRIPIENLCCFEIAPIDTTALLPSSPGPSHAHARQNGFDGPSSSGGPPPKGKRLMLAAFVKSKAKGIASVQVYDMVVKEDTTVQSLRAVRAPPASVLSGMQGGGGMKLGVSPPPPVEASVSADVTADEVDLLWSASGNALLVHTHNDEDKSGCFYYGKSKVWWVQLESLIRQGLKDKVAVKEVEVIGTASDVKWSPVRDEFILISGATPACMEPIQHNTTHQTCLLIYSVWLLGGVSE